MKYERHLRVTFRFHNQDESEWICFRMIFLFIFIFEMHTQGCKGRVMVVVSVQWDSWILCLFILAYKCVCVCVLPTTSSIVCMCALQYYKYIERIKIRIHFFAHFPFETGIDVRVFGRVGRIAPSFFAKYKSQCLTSFQNASLFFRTFAFQSILKYANQGWTKII